MSSQSQKNRDYILERVGRTDLGLSLCAAFDDPASAQPSAFGWMSNAGMGDYVFTEIGAEHAKAVQELLNEEKIIMTAEDNYHGRKLRLIENPKPSTP